MVTENGQGVVQSGNSKETQQQKIAKAAEVKENKEQPETTFDKNFVRICLYVIPIALFFALFDFSNISSLVTGSTGINYVACYGLYIIVIELARKLHTDDKESTHARHVFNQSFVYFPLALFLFTASYALYSAGSEVFGVQPAEQRQAFVQEVDKFLDTYKAQCTQASASTKEQHQCIESYLNATLFADVKLIQEKYGDASNSYSIIAIMTGFFGVLMTVLVIYFSLSGRELLEHKLQKSDELMDDLKGTMKNTKESIEKAIKKAEDASTQAGDALTLAEKATADSNQLLARIEKVQAIQNSMKDKGASEVDSPQGQQNSGMLTDDKPPKEPDGKSQAGVQKVISNTLKTFDGRLNITGGESLKRGLEYKLTFYTCKEDFENRHNPIELKQALPYPFEVDKVNADSAEVIARFDEKTILVVSSHSTISESPASEEVFCFKPSNAPEPNESDNHKK
jgi:hypothetical protein